MDYRDKVYEVDFKDLNGESLPFRVVDQGKNVKLSDGWGIQQLIPKRLRVKVLTLITTNLNGAIKVKSNNYNAVIKSRCIRYSDGGISFYMVYVYSTDHIAVKGDGVEVKLYH